MKRQPHFTGLHWLKKGSCTATLRDNRLHPLLNFIDQWLKDVVQLRIAITLPLWIAVSAWLIPKLGVKLCCCCIRWTPRFNVARWIWRWKHPKTKTR